MAIHTDHSHAISAAELARTPGSARHPLVVDVRRQAAFSASQHLICGSLYRPPEQVATWSRDVPLRAVAPGARRDPRAQSDSVRYPERDILSPRRNLHVRFHD